MTRLERLRQLRIAATMTVTNLPDEQAVKIPTMFDPWAPDISYEVGDRVCYNDKLYKARQAHVSQNGWEPSVLTSLWEAIDETHAGTKEDPIPAEVNMSYENGKYYLDQTDGKIYYCNRSTEIPVAYLPHELVGHYFEEVS